MKTLLIILLLFCELKAQESFTINDFSVTIHDSKLLVQNQNDKIVYQKVFSNPEGFTVDLDNDNIDEFLINDFYEENNQYYYTIYIFSAIDTFYQIDSLYSGLKEPLYVFSSETNSYIIITGSPDFDEFSNIQDDEVFSPIVCWDYNGQEVSIVNDELYDIYINENEKVISYLTMKYRKLGKSCETTKLLKQAIATAYANYYQAGEKSNAESFLKNYYLCNDIEEFKSKIKDLL